MINTVSGRPTYVRDDLARPIDLFDWATAAGRVHDRLPVPTVTPTQGQLRATVDLREHLYVLFASVVAGEPAPNAERWLLDRLAVATRSASLTRRRDGFALVWTGADINALQHTLVSEAERLLCSSDVGRVKACDGCGWLFLDTSRAGGRRWCAMTMCGARHKMRRYHQRHTERVSQ